LVLWPRLTLEYTGAEIDPENPHPIPFTITNTGFMPIYDLKPAVGICEIQNFIGPSTNGCNGPLGAQFVYMRWFAEELTRDEKYTVRFDATGPDKNDGLFYFNSLYKIDISMIVNYHPWPFVFIRARKEFRFTSQIEPNGKLSIRPIPLDK
jgi:hypothetical protein